MENILTFVWAENSHSDIVVMQHMTADGCCHMCPALTNTHLVNPPIKPGIGYPVGSVTKKWFSCQRNQPFEKDVSYLCWLSVIVRAVVQSKALFSDPSVSCRTLCWPPNCHWLVTVLLQGNFKLHFEFLTAFLMPVGGGKDVEIDESCFSRWKCNCGRLRATAWVFVDVKWELETPVLNLSLIALPKHCSSSLRHVSYSAPQSSVTSVGTVFISSMKDSHATLSIAPLFLWRTDAHTNMIEATWKHVSIHPSLYWENEFKCVIHRFKGSLSVEFDDVPEWNLKRFV